MDDKEKSLFESVTDTIKNTVDIAADAAKKALEPEPLKPDEEVVVVPAPVGADLIAPMPPMVTIVTKKRRAAPKKPTSKKAAKKAPAKAAKKSTQAKKSAKKATKKTTKQSAKKSKAIAKKKTAKTPGRAVKKKKKAKRG
jgi:hypothetical protein